MLNLSTPAIWYPGQSDLDFEEEINLMMSRAYMTRDFLQGKIAPDTFLDFLDEQEFDVFELAEDWELVEV
ncbi:hypothetical protein [Calothrix sp. PCC 7507]|uniref:hypothetical protein n=1 Tax=Calothrix sp. PCC 7507 TaxID=99598 RepID=UPI00029F18F6|nr:hypothetical protein [Calothrix sp. PCC 7507]AFY31606.1 hypothetical protein Cal7507_1132 [Calothrix sp. PCC 7507]